MPAQKTFRSAFHGFNREDVIHYLDYLNNRHAQQVEQLQQELAALRQQAQEPAPLEEECARLTAQLEQAQQDKQSLEQRCAELEARLAPAEEPQEEPQPQIDRQLQSYRRADQVEREARDRAELVYFQARAVLREAAGKVDGAAQDITDMADEAMRQLTQLQMAVSSSKQTLQDAAAILDTIRPNP